MAAPTEGQTGFTSVKFNGYSWNDGNYDMTVYMIDHNGYVLACAGTTKPDDGTAGYAIGCIFFHTDGSSGTSNYINGGTTSSCAFTALPTTAGSTATALTVANEGTDTECFPVFVTAATGDLAPKSNTKIKFNSNTGMLTVTGITSTLTGDCSGNAGTVTVDATTTDETCFVALFESASGSLEPQTDASLTYNAATGALTSASFIGALTGAVTGDVIGDVTGNCSGTAGAISTTADAKLQLRDSGLFVNSPADGKILISSDGTAEAAIELATGAAGTVKIDSKITGHDPGVYLDMSSDAVVTLSSDGTSEGSVVIATGANGTVKIDSKITGHDANVYIDPSSDGLLTLAADGGNATGDIILSTAVAKLDGKLVGHDADVYVDLATDGNVTVSGDVKLNLDSATEVEIATATLDIDLTAENGNAFDVLVAQGSTEVGGAVSIIAGKGFTGKAGGATTITSGAGTTTGAGGAMDITAGAGGNDGVGGAAEFKAGAAGGGNRAGGEVKLTGGAGAGSGAGGAATIAAGAAGATGTGGAITITSGAATAGDSGAVTIKSGDISGAGNAGLVTITAGTPTDGDGGSIAITATAGVDAAAAAENGGAITITAGDGDNDGVGGSITLTGGAGPGSGAGGDIILEAGESASGTDGRIKLNDDVEVADGAIIQFRADTEAISSSGVGQLDLDALNEIEMATDVIDIDLGGENENVLDISVAASSTEAGGAIQIIAGAAGAATKLGGAVVITSGAGNTTGTGGAMTITAGSGGNAGIGGAAEFAAGASGGGNTAGGEVKLTGGRAGAEGSGIGGACTIVSGAGGSGAGSGAGGVLSLTSGAGGATSGASGAVNIKSGTTTSGVSGDITIQTGAPTAGNVGTINIFGGTATDGNGGSIAITASAGADPGAGDQDGGNVTITAGAAANSGTAGIVNIKSDALIDGGKKLSFRDAPATATEYIYSSGSAVLDVVGETINLTASTKVDVSGDLEVSNDLDVKGRAVFSTITAIDDDATPSVAGGNVFTIKSTGGARDITDFDDGVAGQIITVIADDGNCTIKDNANLKLAGDFVMDAQYDSITLVAVSSSVWVEISRSSNA